METLLGSRQGQGKCGYCAKILSFGGGGSGNLTRHMRNQHGTVPIEVSCVNPQVDSTLQPPCTEPEGNSAEPASANIPSTSGVEGTRWD